MIDPLALAGLILGPGGVLAGIGGAWWGRKKTKADVAVALNTSTLAWAKDLREDVSKMEARIDLLEAKLRARDAAVTKHMPWDWHVYQALRELGHPVEEPPPLLPVEQH